MPTKNTDAAPAPEMLTVEDLAAARGVTPASIRTAHYRANKASRGMPGGAWPPGQIPKADRGRPVLGWDPRRPEVRAYLEQGRPELLDDRDALEAEYVTKGRSASDIAKELGKPTATVHNALIRHRIPIREGVMTGLSPLADVPLVEMRARVEEHGTLLAAAESYGVGRETFSKWLGRKEADELAREAAAKS